MTPASRAAMMPMWHKFLKIVTRVTPRVTVLPLRVTLHVTPGRYAELHERAGGRRRWR
jgi:hypothetical protein